MTQERPQPEGESTPETRFFNVDAMSDEQLIVAYRGLYLIANRGSLSHDLFEQMSVGDQLSLQLATDVQGSIARNPDRVKALVARLAMSSEDVDRDFAARVAPGLLHYDYDFTRNVLVALIFNEEEGELDTFAESYETADARIRILMRDDLESDQIKEFTDQIHGVDPTYPIEPALPEER